MCIRKLEEKDVKQITYLEKICFSDSWSEKTITQLLDSRLDRCFVLESQGAVRAYGIIRILADEGEIFRVAADPSKRRLGLGSKLMEAMTEYAKAQGAARIMLEVREGNLAARSLYKSRGFQEEGKRKDYYSDPKEDGILMGMTLV